jgi:hypothetical protein
MDRLALLKFVSNGPNSRKEIMDNGIKLNTTFRVTVGELEREGLVTFRRKRTWLPLRRTGGVN